MSKKVYVITAFGGYYEDKWEHAVAVCAEKHLVKSTYNQLLNERNEYRQRLERIIEKLEKRGKDTTDFELALENVALGYRVDAVDFVEVL